MLWIHNLRDPLVWRRPAFAFSATEMVWQGIVSCRTALISPDTPPSNGSRPISCLHSTDSLWLCAYDPPGFRQPENAVPPPPSLKMCDSYWL